MRSETCISTMLEQIMLLSCGASLMRFEQASKQMKGRVSAIIMQTARSNQRIGQESVESLNHLQQPTAFTIHCIETSQCMLCKKPYYGRLHPDFGLHVHEKCLEPHLVDHHRLGHTYPIKRLLQSIPFRSRSGKFHFLWHRHAGFPALSVDEWAAAQDTPMFDMMDYNDEAILMYKNSNKYSAQRVKQDHLTLWRRKANHTVALHGFKGAYSKLLSYIKPCFALRFAVGKGDAGETAMDALHVHKIQNSCPEVVIERMLMSLTTMGEWLRLDDILLFAHHLRNYGVNDMWEVAVLLSEKYLIIQRNNLFDTMIAVQQGKPLAEVERLFAAHKQF